MTAASPPSMTDQPTPPTKRILAFDVLRGYFILLIASVHLHYYPSLLGVFDGRGQLWTSEAEGFFFISGLLIGIIRRRDIVERGFGAAAAKLWRRSFRLYAVSIVLSLLYVMVARLAEMYHVPGSKAGLDQMTDFLPMVIHVLTLSYSYGWADFLNYYVAFLMLSPFLLWLLARRRWPVVLALVFGTWTLRWAGSYGVLDPYMQWQVYFFMGVMAGFYWPHIERTFHSLPLRVRRLGKRAAVIAATAAYAGAMVLVFLPQYFEHRPLPGGWLGAIAAFIQQVASGHLYQTLLVDGRLGLLRPLVWLVVFAGMYVAVRRFESHILRWAGWLLVAFGANSLYAYVVQSALLFCIPFIVGPSGFWLNSLLEGMIIAMVWLAIRKRFLFAVIPR